MDSLHSNSVSDNSYVLEMVIGHNWCVLTDRELLQIRHRSRANRVVDPRNQRVFSLLFMPCGSRWSASAVCHTRTVGRCDVFERVRGCALD